MTEKAPELSGAFSHQKLGSAKPSRRVCSGVRLVPDESRSRLQAARHATSETKGRILIHRLSTVNLDDRGTRRWYVDSKAIRFERH